MDGHNEWLRIATEDLKVAKALLKLEFFSTVTYHSQQSAEKSLKGFLAFNLHPILKSHDLVKLLEKCIFFEPDFKQFLDATKILNPFASKFRYPTEEEIPDLADAKMAIKQAEKILTFVEKKITTSSTGQQPLFKK